MSEVKLICEFQDIENTNACYSTYQGASGHTPSFISDSHSDPVKFKSSNETITATIYMRKVMIRNF